MALLSILQAYNPSIDCGEAGIAEFDAEMDFSLVTRTQVTSYPVETGQEISGSLILLPAEIRFTWGIGLRKLTPLLSTEFAENLTSNAVGIAGGFASNFVDSGFLNFLIGALSNASLYQSDKNSRAFLAMATLQKAQLSGAPLAITIEGLGTMKNMRVTELRPSRSGKDGGKVTFTIVLTQTITPETKNQQDQLIGMQNIGEVKGEAVES
uniref:Dit-like phage tail protein N-terminal domain-containing protein n=8 Tax=Vibrionaceae TaxID=641 RepID=A0A0H4A3F4_9VIBR|nr:hypothetical protein [Vibrio splendidus]AKN36659.1 hypothetical protein [Vibrio sp. FF_482]AKN37834.1 hypothetical protein [Vibrio tasmaniensis]AKN38743.1 hypothetical protein [Enterovibrio norvegicus]AKN38957.1 hypothetical protein [Aliivibrio fischeri]AKN39132.1 hypothetical protein [Vibrio kanaloae]AKN39950.1 hypothetical protein [Vibrio sp. FF_307]